ncbi:transporter substrate-binding domain-containing protein [Amaricoccus solimangrovi]|uniref:Transporter substrate-binding domain-containing protein n=1 Tax=Amaricoccus solimangrovi TaxID=2589815 RepID=A0A501WVT3_9RHOB|nr:transporter substrate-binding domain-containing protein [Amaricoccus solimangrovi]TPE53528.1 transporter substrate-binding domain-containing protein [Amaricoccus solimangrovi]
MKTLLGALAALALGAPVPAAALGICFEGSYPPFSEVGADGVPVGFDIDIARALCAEIGESCDFVQTRWTEMIPALRGGRCDAIVASMSDTPERRELIDFTVPYYRSPVRFVGPEAAPGGADWPGAHVIGVQLGTVNQSYMARHFPGTPLRLYGNQEHLLLDLYAGRVDAVMGEGAQLDTGFLRTPAGKGFVFIGAPMFDPAIQGTGAAVGVRKADAALRDRLSAAIEAIRRSGAYRAIEGKYFAADISGG